MQNWGEAKLYDIPVYDGHGNCVVNLKCVSVKRIGDTKPGSVDQVASKFKNEGFDLSDMLSPGKGTIDMLVGCNYSNLQPQPISILGTATLASTRFGKVIYGSHPTFPVQDYVRNTPSVYIETVVAVQCPLIYNHEEFTSSLKVKGGKTNVNCQPVYKKSRIETIIEDDENGTGQDSVNYNLTIGDKVEETGRQMC